MATLLSIVQEACAECGAIAQPSAVISNSDETVARMLVLLGREGKELVQTANWTVLQRLYTFPTVDATAEYSLPADFSRLIVQTEWDRSNLMPIYGPLDPQDWQTIKSSGLGSGITGRRYRIYRSSTTTGRKFTIDPTPTSANDNETLAFEYISSYYCQTSGGTAQAAWAADTDTPIVDADLLTLGLIVRFKRSTGLDYASEADEYAQMLSRKKAQDRPAPVLSLVPTPSTRLLSSYNVPQTGFTG